MPNLAIVKPQPGDEVTSSWGTSVADALNGVQAGQVTVPAITGAGSTIVPITFPRAYSSPPVIVLGIGSAVCQAAYSALTATGMSVSARRTDGGGTTSQAVSWLAIGTPA